MEGSALHILHALMLLKLDLQSFLHVPRTSNSSQTQVGSRQLEAYARQLEAGKSAWILYLCDES